jgi:hypothetical protein
MESIWIELYNRTTAPDGTERVSEPPRRIRRSYKSEDLELLLCEPLTFSFSGAIFAGVACNRQVLAREDFDRMGKISRRSVEI